MKFGGIDSIEQILRRFVEETHNRDEEDRKLSEYLKMFLSGSEPHSEPHGLRDAIYYLHWSLDSNIPLDRADLNKPSANDPQSESAPSIDDNSDEIPF